MNTLIIRLLILFLLFPLAANAGVWETISGKSAYPVKESGYWLDASNAIYWIDDQQVLFAGGDLKGYEEHGVQIKAGKNPKLGLYIWNISTGNVRSHTMILPYSTLCYRDGRIEYTVEAKDGYLVRKKGTLVDVREVQEAPSQNWPHISARAKGEAADRLNCRIYSFYDLPKGVDLPLIDGHGFLGWRGGSDLPWPAGGEAPVRYYKDATSPPIILPLKRKDIRTPDVPSPAFYAEWANVYVLQGGIEWGSINNFGQLPKQSPYPVYLLSPGSGDLKVINTPYAKWITGSMQYHYSKPGLILASFAAKAGGVGNSGLYRADEKGYQKIISGFPKAVSISPDGCRLAAGLQYTDKRGYNGPIELKVIDLCKGAK